MSVWSVAPESIDICRQRKAQFNHVSTLHLFLVRLRSLRAFIGSSLSAGHGAARRRFHITTNVSVLRTHHAAPRNLLPGVWQITQVRLNVETRIPTPWAQLMGVIGCGC